MKRFPLLSICHQLGSAELPVLPGHSTLNHSWDDNTPFLSPLLPKQSWFNSVRASTVNFKSPIPYLRGSSSLSTLPASAQATLGADMAWPADRAWDTVCFHTPPYSSPLSCWGGEQMDRSYISSYVAAHSKFPLFQASPWLLIIADLAHYLGTQNSQVVVPTALLIKEST